MSIEELSEQLKSQIEWRRECPYQRAVKACDDLIKAGLLMPRHILKGEDSNLTGTCRTLDNRPSLAQN
jgi:hypothetical protein